MFNRVLNTALLLLWQNAARFFQFTWVAYKKVNSFLATGFFSIPAENIRESDIWNWLNDYKEWQKNELWVFGFSYSIIFI